MKTIVLQLEPNILSLVVFFRYCYRLLSAWVRSYWVWYSIPRRIDEQLFNFSEFFLPITIAYISDL
jgi:hypothetical protein